MAGFIIFRSGKSWAVANWAFRRLIEDIIVTYNHDRELAEKLQVCEYHQGVDFQMLDASLGDRILAAIRDIAKRTVEGEAGLGVLETPDPEQRRTYIDAVRQLLNSIDVEIRDPPADPIAGGPSR